MDRSDINPEKRAYLYRHLQDHLSRDHHRTHSHQLEPRPHHRAKDTRRHQSHRKGHQK